jgi:hypothetical protein
LSRHSEADGTGANKRFKLVHPRIMGFARPSRRRKSDLSNVGDLVDS